MCMDTIYFRVAIIYHSDYLFELHAYVCSYNITSFIPGEGGSSTGMLWNLVHTEFVPRTATETLSLDPSSSYLGMRFCFGFLPGLV